LSVDKNAQARAESTIARNPLWLNVNIKFAHKNNTAKKEIEIVKPSWQTKVNSQRKKESHKKLTAAGL